MIFLPICINIENKKILIVGGGQAALHKIKTIYKYSDKIIVVAPQVDSEIYNMKLAVQMRNFEWSDLEGCFMVYAATDDKSLNTEISKRAQEKNILVNVCDNPALSSFVSPAIFKKDNMSVAVSSNSTNVKKSISWRDKIQGFFSND